MSEHKVSGVEGGARVATRRADASDATRDTVHAQLQSDIGGLSAAWTVVDGGEAAPETLRRPTAALGLAPAETARDHPA
jgi:hypothetical protein